jgi:hypothetical protein
VHTNFFRDSVALQLPASFAQRLQIPKGCITTLATGIDVVDVKWPNSVAGKAAVPVEILDLLLKRT